jgi:Excalibur calcium-binding domain
MIVVISRKEVSAILLALGAIAFYCVLLAATPSGAQNLQNCSDFPSQAAAQANLRANPSDPNHLDANHNGIACEVLPYPPGSPTDFNPVSLQTNPTMQITNQVTNPGTVNQGGNQGGGVVAIAGSSRSPRGGKSVINIPKKPLPPSGGLPVYGGVGASVLTAQSELR